MSRSRSSSASISKHSEDTFQLLSQEQAINFQGNIEGRDILLGDIDVIVTDGFSGNIALKTCEGTASLVMKMIMAADEGYKAFRQADEAYAEGALVDY